MSEVHIACIDCKQFIKIDLAGRPPKPPILCPHCLAYQPDASNTLHDALRKFDQDLPARIPGCQPGIPDDL